MRADRPGMVTVGPDADLARELKRSNASLARMNRALSALRRVNEVIVHERDPAAMAAAACRILVETRGYEAACIALCRSGATFVLAEEGWPAGALRPILDRLGGDGPTTVDGKSCSVDGAWGPLPGSRAAVARLPRGNGVDALLVVSFPPGTEIAPEEIALVREIADDLAGACRSLEVYAAREAAEARYHALVDNANVAIVVSGEDTVITEANRHAVALFGGALVGRSALDIVDLSDRAIFREYSDALARFGNAFLPDLAVRRVDGTIRSVEASVATVLVGGQRVSFVVYRDTTEEKRLRAQVMVSDRMASVGTLAAGVAHEINNPLAVVVANVEFLLAELESLTGSSPDAYDALRDVKAAADRVRDIVRDMKLFSRAESTGSEPVDVELILDSTARMAHNEIKHRAKLVKRYGGVPLVDANESRLGQVFLNLMVNAAQAIGEGRADANEIELSTRVDERGLVVVEVRDTGAGMPPAVLQKLFTPFFTTKPRGVGTGLGLAICMRIVEELSGQITVESEVGKGTTFRVFLPASVNERVEATPSRVVAPAPRRGSVLVIDDESMVGASVRRILSGEHDVEVFTDAALAIERIRNGARYDVILCDLMMPVVTGVEFHDALVRLAPDAVPRLVFLTGGAFTAVARDFLEDTKCPSVEKPFDGPALRELVNRRLA